MQIKGIRILAAAAALALLALSGCVAYPGGYYGDGSYYGGYYGAPYYAPSYGYAYGGPSFAFNFSSGGHWHHWH